jgi:hypothetical protein
VIDTTENQSQKPGTLAETIAQLEALAEELRQVGPRRAGLRWRDVIQGVQCRSKGKPPTTWRGWPGLRTNALKLNCSCAGSAERASRRPGHPR